MNIIYSFQLDDRPPASFTINIDDHTLTHQLPVRATLPTWTRLEHQRCPGCPLATTSAINCPMAESLVDLLEFSEKLDSFRPLAVTITTPEREIRTAVTAQRAISALMGLLIATSGCPAVAWLRPMARFHLPLASEEETIYRAASMYLLAQYFCEKHGQSPDWMMQGLRQRYQRLHEINIAMAERMRNAIERDAPVNAVILLDLFAKAMPYSVDDSLAELEYLFQPYLTGENA
jgi:hypothetical protein